MTERKTLNRYYPVDYDPAKIPKLKQKQKEQNRLWGIRVMAPFNMRCNTCGDYIYKGKKFNSRMEKVRDKDYLGIQIHRFYIRCPKCVGVIAFKTDPENVDYELESGATRNFEAAKTLAAMEKKKQDDLEAEEAANPMKVLENRTKQSRNEMDTMEALNELREINARNEKIDHEGMIKKGHLYQQELERLQKEEEDRIVRELFGGSKEEMNGETIRRLDSDDSEDDDWTIPAKRARPTSDDSPSTSSDKVSTSGVSTAGDEIESRPTDLLTSSETTKEVKKPKPLPHKKPTSTKALMSNLVKIKKSTPTDKSDTNKAKRTSASADISKSDKTANKDSASIDSKSDINKTGQNVSSATSNTSNNGQANKGALGMLGNYSFSSDSDSN